MKKRQQLQPNCFQCAPAYFPFTTDWKREEEEKKEKREREEKKREKEKREKRKEIHSF